MALQNAMLFPSPDNPLLDLLSDPPGVQSLTLASPHSDPQGLETLSAGAGREGVSEPGSLDRGRYDSLAHGYI